MSLRGRARARASCVMKHVFCSKQTFWRGKVNCIRGRGFEPFCLNFKGTVSVNCIFNPNSFQMIALLVFIKPTVTVTQKIRDSFTLTVCHSSFAMAFIQELHLQRPRPHSLGRKSASGVSVYQVSKAERRDRSPFVPSDKRSDLRPWRTDADGQ